jgi:D-arabinose 5-phosphate isomerase GutQ
MIPTMLLDHLPIQNSEVYLLGASRAPSIPPPSPPSPATPGELDCSPPLDDLMSITPPETQDPTPLFKQRLSNAVHVLSTEATALSCLARLYDTDPIARQGFNSAVEAITRFKGDKGKLIISGVGKSGHIAKKLVATMNSLRIHATYLHPTEALHGDLGKVGKYDSIILITFSGKTVELLSLLPHFDPSLPLIVITSHTDPSTCDIVKHRPDAMLLPAPIHRSETDSFGFSAPTTSTTMALALGDALAVAVSNELYANVAAVFLQNHPGGAIGASLKRPQKLSDICIRFSDIPDISNHSATGAHVLMSAYRSETGWVRLGMDIVVPPRRIQKLQPDHMDEAASQIYDLMVSRKDWIEIAAETVLPTTRDWIESQRQGAFSSRYSDDSILALIDGDEIVGFIEIGELMT